MQAQYGHRAIKCYLREFCERKNGRHALFLVPLALVKQLFNNLCCFPFYNEAYINRCTLAFKRINGTVCLTI